MKLERLLGERAHNPDVLDCLANISSDEVFTPPQLANAMLDLLPEEVWRDPDLRWLDPACKSGVFLREAARRLMKGLEEAVPDEAARREHIFKNMLYGVAITELTGQVSRRSLYYSKDATYKGAVVRFDDPDGNILQRRSEHQFDNKLCVVCRAPDSIESSEREGLENHAYTFIHEDDVFDMKFDVVIGNPPYQLQDGGHGASASPIYQIFVQKAMALDPRYIVMITPSRWFMGGKGLDGYRAQMLADKRLKVLVDYPKLYDCFPGVKIRGGVSYFLWDRDYEGSCSVQTMWDNQPVGPSVSRYLDAYDVLIRRNEAVPILEKVRSFRVKGQPEPALDARVSSAKPFGLRTFFHGGDSPKGMKDPVKLYGSQKISWIERSEISHNEAWVNTWKVLASAVQGTSAAVERQFLGKPIVAGPGEACTETYLVTGRFESEAEAQRYASYLRTRFVRFLVSLRKSTQHATRSVYAFIPDIPLDREWTDEMLYKRYGLDKEEIAHIEETVKEMSE